MKQEELIKKLYQWSELNCEADLTKNDCKEIVNYLFSINSSTSIEALALPTIKQTKEVCDWCDKEKEIELKLCAKCVKKIGDE